MWPPAHPREEVRERERDRDAHEPRQQADPDREEGALEEHRLEEALPVRQFEGRRVERPRHPVVEARRHHDPERDQEEDHQHPHRERQDAEGPAGRLLADAHDVTTTQASAGKSTATSAPCWTGTQSRGEPATITCSPTPQSTKHSKSSPRSRTNTTVPGSALRRGHPVRDELGGLGPDGDGHLAGGVGIARDVEGVTGDRDRAVTRRLADQQVGPADESGHERRPRPPVHLERRADLLDPAGVHHDDQVRHRHRLPLVVRDDDRRDPELLLEEPELHLELLPEVRVQRGQRLVQEEEPGLQRQRPCGRHALALSPGELLDPAVAQPLERDELEQLRHPRGDPLLLRAADPQPVADVAGDVQVREQREALEDHPDVAPVRRPVGDVVVVEEDPALGRMFEPGDHPQHRGLAASGRVRGTRSACRAGARDRRPPPR